MIDGLKLTFSGEELRQLLEARIEHHDACAERWAHETTRTREDATEDAPLLPDHMCTNEAERHAWRADVLQFMRDHVEPAETYRLSAEDLEAGELLPAKPGWLEQHEFEEDTRVGFALERMTKILDRLVGTIQDYLSILDSQERRDAPLPGIIEETDEFRTTRLDAPDGMEVIMVERKD